MFESIRALAPRLRTLRKYSRTILAVFACTVGLLRGFAYCFSFDRDVGYYHSSGLTVFFRLATVLFAVLLGSEFFLHLLIRDTKPSQTATEVTVPFARPLPARICAWPVFCALVGCFLYFALSVQATGGNLFAWLLPLCAVLSSLYFILPLRRSTVTCGLAFLAFLIVAVITEYRDWDMTMNSPIKVWQILAYCSSLMAMLAELREWDGSAKSLFRYPFFASLSIFFSVSGGLSLLLSAVIGSLAQEPYAVCSADYLVRATVLMTYGIYSFALLSRRPQTIAIPQNPSTKEDTPHATGNG